jgi:hypothetical protein
MGGAVMSKDIRFLGGEVELSAEYGKDVEGDIRLLSVVGLSIQFSPTFFLDVAGFKDPMGRTVADILADEYYEMVEGAIAKQVEA